MTFMISKRKGQATRFRNALLAAMVTATTTLALPILPANANDSVSAPESNTASVIKRALPKYPKYAVKNGIEGAVLVNFSIESDGNVSDIEVVASDQDGLFDATAILGVQKWLYTKPHHKIRNNYVAIEFALTDAPKASQFSHVEKIQVRPD
ncbi:energy transducer TonB [Alteromonas gracilis]|uniref:energy transducer TonB n=1 Tax=Alteromonas gracilis TaxID=1479524 RepID=UPI0030CE1373